MTIDDLQLALAYRVENSVRNWSLKRSYEASLAKITEGFTEHWGDTSAASSPTLASWNDADRLQDILSTHHPQQPIVLFQYRPAWEEQLLLRSADIPHVVVNSQYAVNETTGPLPCLRDLSNGRPPALIGRNSGSSLWENSIETYLREHHGVNQNDIIPESLVPTATLLDRTIRQTLTQCLLVARYDEETFDQVYRKQCIAAGGGSWWMNIGQIRGEQLHLLGSLSRDIRAQSLEQFLQQARESYEILEKHLMSSPGKFLMGTEKPVRVDVALFAHVAEALTDVHLVVVLADFPLLCKFFQTIWDDYFALSSDRRDWRVWNMDENARNAFCTLPTLPSSVETGRSLKHAVELMEQLSMRNHELHEQVSLAKQVRDEQGKVLRKRRPCETWHRWRMGDDWLPSAGRSVFDTNHAKDKEAQSAREYRRNDEFWLATVLATSLASVLLLGFAGGQQR